jgi:flagellar biogenesis protein FliO
MASGILLLIEVTGVGRSIWLDYAKTLLILGGVCCIAVFLIKYLLPKIMGADATPSDQIQIFARQSLEPRKMLYLVRAGKSVVLLASSGDTVQFMTALDPQDFIIGDAFDSVVKRSAHKWVAQTIAGRKKGITE